ncbi:MAG: hypothetical protein R2725_03865 [Solirubrobacterales bacterium]
MLKRAVLTCALVLLLAPAAADAAMLGVGKVRVARSVGDRLPLLLALRLPTEMLGRPVEARVRVAVPGAKPRTYRLRGRASGGPPRVPERRRRFGFVLAADLGKRLSRLVRARARPRAAVLAIARLDVDGDGVPEQVRRGRRGFHRVGAAGKRLCESVPQLRARPGERVAVRLPRCGTEVRWK